MRLPDFATADGAGFASVPPAPKGRADRQPPIVQNPAGVQIESLSPLMRRSQVSCCCAQPFGRKNKIHAAQRLGGPHAELQGLALWELGVTCGACGSMLLESEQTLVDTCRKRAKLDRSQSVEVSPTLVEAGPH